jgi:endonuclease YncB( thermonuclease family)
MEPTYIYRAICARVVDGDTFVAHIDLGFYVSATLHIRLAGVNAPEMHGPSKEDGRAAAMFLQNLLKSAPLMLQSHKDERSFERWVCDVYLPSGRSVAQAIIDEGHGVPV